MLTFKKGADTALSDHFKAKDFDCPCANPECTQTHINEDLVHLLNDLRNRLGCPLIVGKGGGYRCLRYEKELAARGYETAKGVSQHSLGAASDVNTDGAHTGFQLEEAARGVGFLAVGVGTNWIHVDLRKPENRSWYYHVRPGDLK